MADARRRRPRGRPTPRQSLGVAKDPFIEELAAACTTARQGFGRPAGERNRQVEDAFFRAASSLETFLSEWFVRALSFDTSRFRLTHQGKAENFAKHALNTYEPADRLWQERGAQVGVAVTLPILKAHTLEATRGLLGCGDGNLSFRHSADLIVQANDYLVDEYASRPRHLGPERTAVIDATLAIRNVIAHRSAQSATRMNECLRSANLPTSLRRGADRDVSSSGVGYFLQADGGGRPRFETYFTILGEMAHTLAPTDGRRRVICPP